VNKVTFFPKHFTYESIFADRFLTLFLVGLLSTSTLISCSPHVQNRRPITEVKEAKTAGQIISDMKTEIRLTDEQEVNIRPVIEEQVKKRNELIKKYQGRDCHGADCLKDELKDLRISTENQLQYFLTNDQMIKYGNMQQEEDQKITGKTSVKTQEGVTQEEPKGRSRRSGRF
jgi:predicted metal-dependent hydrolase